MYYLSLNWINRNFKYEQDRLHPYDCFDGGKPLTVSMEDWRRWRGNRNRLANLQLLEGMSNGSKNDMRLVDYYNDMNDEQKATFRKRAIIPGQSFPMVFHWSWTTLRSSMKNEKTFWYRESGNY